MRYLARLSALVAALLLVWSVPASAAIPKPTLLTASATSAGSIGLQWVDNSTVETHFEIQRSLFPNKRFRKVATAPANAIAFTDTGLAASTTYYYRVRAVKKGAGSSPWSNVAGAATSGGTPPIDTIAPSAPAQVGAGAASCSQVNVAWSAATDNAGGSGIGKYNLYRNNVLVKSITAPSNTAADTGLNPSTQYSYAVTAVDNAGNESAKSTSVTATTPACGTVVPVPGGLRADSTSCGFATTAWNPIFDPNDTYKVTKYNLYRNGMLAKTVNAAVTTVVDTNLSPLTTYSYTVTAVNASNVESAKSVAVATRTTACPPAGAWAKTAGGTGPEMAEAVAVDGAGNVIVGGTFRGTADFGGGPVTAGPNGDMFVAKYSPARTLLWVEHYPSSATANELNAIAVDASGNIFVGGAFFGTVNLGGGSLVNGQAGYRDAFVAKYSATGVHQWSRRYGGVTDDGVNGIALDSLGNPVVTGVFRGENIDFGGRALSNAGGAFGGQETFVVKLSSANATNLLARVTGCSGTDYGRDVAIDAAGNIIVTGLFASSCTFGGAVMLPQNNSDAYVVKYSATGAILWVKTFGNKWGDIGNAVAVDGSGNVVVTGTFAEVVDFGTGPLGQTGWTPWTFVVKLNGNGAPVWATAFGSNFATHGYGIAADTVGNVTVTGAFQGTVDFGGGPLTVPSVPGSAGLNAFVAQYSATGAHVASNRYGDHSNTQGRAVARGPSGAVAAGYYTGSIDLGFGPSPSAGFSDIFFLNTGR